MIDFDSPSFINSLTYSKNNLGVTLNKNTATFRLWAPTAFSVCLNLFEDGKELGAFAHIDMNKSEGGTWVKNIKVKEGTYYTYTVKTEAGEMEAVDPYATSGGVNGLRGMVVDLKSTDPENFEKDSFVKCKSYYDAVIWETHVRDFSNKIISSKNRGKYLAFTEKNLKNSYGEAVGIDHLKKLGITHVQLQPVFDYGSGNEEDTSTWFNWGYDPANYNFPEGSYSSDPYNGKVRITELKRLVQALHKEKIGVIMDVVYNHTFFVTSNLWKTVPYYYYRYKGWQTLSNGSGCGNETATERTMFRKYIIDSVLYWQREYHIDGFRFDLMSLCDKDTMNLVEEKLHRVNPYAIIYGEPWCGGDTVLPPDKMANRANLEKNNGIFVFNDTLRDGIKGSVFDMYGKGYINGNPNYENADKICRGMSNDRFVNYVACHDNFTFWDKICLTCQDLTDDEKLNINMFGASILDLSKGAMFMLSGEEMLRSKHFDGNSYMSSDVINNLDWNSIKKGSIQNKSIRLYSKLIAVRKKYSNIFQGELKCEILNNNVISVTYSNNSKTVAYALLNPTSENIIFKKPEKGEYKVVFNGQSFPVYKKISRAVTVKPCSALFVVKEK